MEKTWIETLKYNPACNHWFSWGASLCFGLTKTLLCEAKTSRRSH